MVLRQTYRAERGRPVVPEEDWALAASSGEIYDLWYFVQGSIMNPDVRLTLRNAWGFCERHAWIAIQVEAAIVRAQPRRPYPNRDNRWPVSTARKVSSRVAMPVWVDREKPPLRVWQADRN